MFLLSQSIFGEETESDYDESATSVRCYGWAKSKDNPVGKCNEEHAQSGMISSLQHAVRVSPPTHTFAIDPKIGSVHTTSTTRQLIDTVRLSAVHSRIPTVEPHTRSSYDSNNNPQSSLCVRPHKSLNACEVQD